MLFSQPPTLLSLLFTILSTTHISYARPKITDQFRELLESRYHYLAERDCVNPCGWRAPGSPPPLCCGSDQTCSTNSLGQAVCNSGGGTVANAQGQSPAQAGWQYYTTTIVESGLVTRTTTYSTAFGSGQTAVAAAQVSGISCHTDMGEKPCGTICCATGQYCVYAGQCGASNGNGDGSSSSILGAIFTPTVTNTAPLRPTSKGATTITTTGSATTTVAFSTPTSMAATATAAAGAAGVSSSNNGLSGAAIAGIVVGVLAGIIILLLLIFCCCAATAGNALLAFFGLGKKRRRREDVTYIEEHRHHHGSSGAAVGRRWFGLGPARVDRPRKKKSGVGGFTAVAGGLTTLAIILGLKRKRDRKEKSEYGSSSYYSDYYSYDSKSTYTVADTLAKNIAGSESSRSDDRYTRRSGRSASRR